LITLLHKGRGRSSLNNWRPITLLNSTYKIFTKALQIRLQPILREVIDHDRSSFLPMRFILDNIFLTHETLHPSRTSRSSENSRFPYVFHLLVVSCKFRSICLAKFVRQIWTSSSHDIFTSSICIINTLISHILRTSPFHVYHTIETHITTHNTAYIVGHTIFSTLFSIGKLDE
jgi:hypothetical protein